MIQDNDDDNGDDHCGLLSYLVSSLFIGLCQVKNWELGFPHEHWDASPLCSVLYLHTF